MKFKLACWFTLTTFLNCTSRYSQLSLKAVQCLALNSLTKELNVS